MYQNIKIEGLDHFGRGISHINNKVVFVKNALPDEVVDINIVQDKKDYAVAIVLKYIKTSRDRIDSVCPYYGKCGGCHLLHMDYINTLKFKKNKVKELMFKNKITYDKEIEVVNNPNPLNYRNKVSLKIIDGKIGYYEAKTHKLVEIKECLIANHAINKVISNYEFLGIKNGDVVIRVNQNDEVLIIIDVKDKVCDIKIEELKKIIKLVGIIYNKKNIYGDSFLMERIGGYLFKVSYDAFFQVNPFICKELFNIIKSEVTDNSKVLDLYSGVGTLGIVASKMSSSVLSVEIVKNAVINGILNAKLNNSSNIKFMLGNVANIVDKIPKDFDILILDPPRSGVDKNTISFIKKVLPKKIIYVSCDVNTLMRDLKSLENYYEINNYKILDMFSYSYHVESLVVLGKIR